MVCVWAPPSDQPANSWVVSLLACGDGALTDSVDPVIAVRVNGVGSPRRGGKSGRLPGW
jgi:hypothetical protein